MTLARSVTNRNLDVVIVVNKTIQRCGEELKDPNLLINIMKEMDMEGLVGEYPNKLVLTIAGTLRLVKNITPTSSNIVVTDESGGGKDNMVKKAAKVMLPEKDYFHRVRLSDKVFTYWNTNDDDFTWDGTLVHFEDPEDSFLESQSFRVLASGENSKETIIKDQKATEYKRNGKPVLIITTFKASPDSESIRRWTSINCDVSEELTNAVKKRSGDVAEGKIEYKPNKNLREGLQCLLLPQNVIIPDASKLCELLSAKVGMRTSINNLYDYIKACAVLHQFQRDRNEDGKVVANMFDILVGYTVYVLLMGNFGKPITRNQRKILEVLEKHDNEDGISHKEIESKTGLPSTTTYDNIQKLIEISLVETVVEKYNSPYEGNPPKEVKTYRLSEFGLIKDSSKAFSIKNRITSLLLEEKEKGQIRQFGVFQIYKNLVDFIKERSIALNLTTLTNLKIAEFTIYTTTTTTTSKEKENVNAIRIGVSKDIVNYGD